MSNPKVFISHASEDKETLVLPLATALRERGLDVWLDVWEMLPGDSLIKKIFTEGLDDADAVVVIVSSVSVTKRWVAEELDAAVVRRIEKDTLLIPVVAGELGPREVPSALRHLLFEPVPDPTDLDEAVDRIVRAVLNQRDKPNLGQLPAYAADVERPPPIEGLDRVDTLVLKLAGEEAVRDDGTLFQTQEFLDSTVATLGVAEDQVIESLRVLDADGFVEIHRSLGGGVEAMSSFLLTSMGLETYASAFIPGYGEMQRRVISQLVAAPEQGTDAEITARADVPSLLTLHVMKVLEFSGLLNLSESIGPSTHYFDVSPKARRLLDQ